MSCSLLLIRWTWRDVESNGNSTNKPIHWKCNSFAHQVSRVFKTPYLLPSLWQGKFVWTECLLNPCCTFPFPTLHFFLVNCKFIQLFHAAKIVGTWNTWMNGLEPYLHNVIEIWKKMFWSVLIFPPANFTQNVSSKGGWGISVIKSFHLFLCSSGI